MADIGFLGAVPEGKVHGSLAVVAAPLASPSPVAAAVTPFLGASIGATVPVPPAPLAKYAVSEGTKAVTQFLI